MQFSVLISVYHKANAEHFFEALESTLVRQSLAPDEVVIVKDGPLTSELEEVIEMFAQRYPSIVKIIALTENVGLGNALRVGLEHCSFELVARMDADDINNEDRFRFQIDAFLENPGVHVLGGQIAEFYDLTSGVKSVRRVPLSSEKILGMCRHRNPMNHVSVMFKKSAVLEAGSYMHLSYLEDYYLWVRMLSKGYRFMNIDEPLVYVRTGEAMFARKIHEQIKGWLFLQKQMKRDGINWLQDFAVNMIAIVGFCLYANIIKRICL